MLNGKERLNLKTFIQLSQLDLMDHSVPYADPLHIVGDLNIRLDRADDA